MTAAPNDGGDRDSSDDGAMAHSRADDTAVAPATAA